MGRKFGSEMAWKILDMIADGFEILGRSRSQPGALLRYGLDGMRTLEIERERARKTLLLYRLRKKGLIEERRLNDRRAYSLTQLGERFLMEHKRVDAAQMPEGTFTMVSFDIPEQNRDARRQFRFFLKKLGFTRKHLSVWVSDRDWFVALKAEIHRLKISGWVIVMKGEDIPISDNYNK